MHWVNHGICRHHRDTRDLKTGMCALVGVGDYTRGGSLVFPEIAMALDTIPGDVIFFQAYALSHYNTAPLKDDGTAGSWFSVVYSSDNSLYFGQNNDGK